MPAPFQNSDKRRQAEKLRTSTSPAARLMRDIAHASSRPKPNVMQIRQSASDLLRLAQRSGKAALVTKLRKILNALQGNVTAAAAEQATQALLSLAGPGAHAIRAQSSQAARKQRKAVTSNLSKVERLLAAMQGKADPQASGGSRVQQPPPATPPRHSGAPMPRNAYMLANGRVRIKTGTFDRTYKLDDPVLTGQMIPVTSSNVHSIGFKMNYPTPTQSTIYVRYLGNKDGVRSGLGPMYEYFDIHPDQFQSFVKAASKGIWVWDHLRVRGSRVQHQYKYSLKAVVNRYMPRRATVRNGREMFVKRRRQLRAKPGEKPVTLTSPLPEQDLGPARGRPKSGRPNRGRPNRGR